jgi:hypothetical protein
MRRKSSERDSSQIVSLIRPPRRFTRSIHLERDFGDPSALEDYVVTAEVQSIIARIGRGLQPGSTQRAWRITGDYGSGKSSLAVLLASVASRGVTGLPKGVRVRLKLKGPVAEGGLVPVLVTGTRVPVREAILSGLVAAFEGFRGARRPAFLARARKALAGGASDDQFVITVIHDAMDYFRRQGEGGGIILILDELGKFLEFALMNPQAQDVYFLQQLAELASRSHDVPFLVLGLLHQGFGSYVQDSSTDIQREWEKIAGRFEEIVLRPSALQMMELAASALNVKREQVPRKVASLQERLFEQAMEAGLFPGGGDGSEMLDAVGIYPINPGAFAVLQRLFRHFGQNERSLFSFLSGAEPSGLIDFASQHKIGAFLRAHDVFDYVRVNMAHRLRHETGSRWVRIDDLVASFSADDPALVEVLKAVGILNLLDSQGLRATAAVVELVLAETNGSERVRRALAELSERGVLYRRGAEGDYCLWPHTSLDLRQRYEDASAAVGELRSVVPELLGALETRPLVGRRHYIETGNLRAMSVASFACRDAAQALEQEAALDGRLLVLLCESAGEQEAGRALARSSLARGNQRCLIAVTRPLKDFAADVQELRRWRWISENSPEIANDRFAEREISRRLELAQRRVSDALSEVLGFRRITGRLRGVEWYYRGKDVPIRSARDLLRQISQIFDTVYQCAPRVHNELLNRVQLSSAAAAARMRLLERIFEHPQDELLGMDPSRKPPEMSMYLSVLKQARLHVRRGNGYTFALPKASADPCHLAPVFQRILEWLQGAGETRQPLTQLVQILRQPPFGVRDGLILVLLAVFLATHEQDVALYEDGAFVRRVTGLEFARMAKKLEGFELQYCRIAGVRREVFQRLLEVLGEGGSNSNTRNEATVLDVVRPLMAFMGGTTDYARQTQALGEPCLAVRRAILAAREPSTLLFKDLPAALGFPSFEAAARAKGGGAVVSSFVDALRAALDEVREAYPQLLSRIAATLRTSFEMGVAYPLGKVRTVLSRRAQALIFALREPSLKAFCMRLADTGLSDDAWLSSIGSLICAKPPARWSDADEARFRDGLALSVAGFAAAESLVFPAGEAPPDQARAMRLSIMLQDGVQVERVLRFSGAQVAQVSNLRGKIQAIVGPAGRNESLAVLSELLLDLSQGSDGHATISSASRRQRRSV